MRWALPQVTQPSGVALPELRAVVGTLLCGPSAPRMRQLSLLAHRQFVGASVSLPSEGHDHSTFGARKCGRPCLSPVFSKLAVDLASLPSSLS